MYNENLYILQTVSDQNLRFPSGVKHVTQIPEKERKRLCMGNVGIKAVKRGEKRSRRYRDRHFAKFERSRRYRDRYRC